MKKLFKDKELTERVSQLELKLGESKSERQKRPFSFSLWEAMLGGRIGLIERVDIIEDKLEDIGKKIDLIHKYIDVETKHDRAKTYLKKRGNKNK